MLLVGFHDFHDKSLPVSELVSSLRELLLQGAHAT
jgi:hypothetical protein